MEKLNKLMILIIVFVMVISLAACGPTTDETADTNAPSENTDSSETTDSGSDDYGWDEAYKIPNVTLCEHDPFDFSRINGAQFRMRADVYVYDGTDDQQPEIFKMLDKALLCYTTGTLEEVKAFFEENVVTGADLDALDAANRCRMLVKGASSSKLEYLEIDNPASTGFYKVGVDLITMNSICQTPGEYHFFIVSVTDGKIKWVEEAQETFTMTQDMIDVRNGLIDFVYTTSFETNNPEAANYSPEEKVSIIQENITAEIGSNIGELEVLAEYVEDDSFNIIISKGDCSKTKTVDIMFGPPADINAWLTKIKGDHLDTIDDANCYGLTCSFGPAYDETQAVKMFVCYSSENLETVRENLMPLTYEEIEAMYPVEGDIYLRLRDVMTTDSNGNQVYALSAGSKDVINHDVDMFETDGTYYMYVGVLSEDGVLWIGQLEDPLKK